MSKIKHTPLPFQRSDRAGSDTVGISDANHEFFMEIDSTRSASAVDNGLFVLRACNSYPDMLAALEAYEKVDEHVANCEDCCDGAHPEMCEECFPLADDARLLMRAVLAKVRGEL
jgi:hypothetical protein